MTVSSSTNKVQYNGNGSTTVFAYTFKIFDQDDLTVIIRSATGTETTKTITTHYTVSGVGNDGGGNVTMLTAPASGETITILREQPLTQGLDLVPNDPFPAGSLEDALDKLVFMVQQHDEELARTIKASRTNTITSTEFTISAADRANKIFGFDAAGELSVTQELGTYTGNWAASTSYAQRDIIKDTSNNNIYICITAHTSSGSQPISGNADVAKWGLLVDAAAATTSATNAAASASAAATSATNAANSATAAAASESAAATSASNASTSETNAGSSATNAAASATAAAASETAAGTSETNAAASETAAAGSASAAATSASNAATSETNAASSASTASTAATTATTQATAAASSATAAAASESAAATSETNAATSATNAAASFDSFDDRYLGAKSSDPTVDNDGDPLITGALYFNTSSDQMFVWNGSAWQSTEYFSNNVDINGGTIDGTVIGGTTPAAISGTTGTFSGAVTAPAFIGDGSGLTGLTYSLFSKADASAVAWTKTGSGTAETQTTIYAEVNGSVLTVASGTSITMPTLTAGTDYAIWLETDGDLVATTDHTSPPTANGRKIGGFHYAAGSNATAQSGGNTTAQINEYSFWDLNFRPACPDPRGMTLVGGGFWVDIYLTGVDAITNGSSKYNVTIADGSSPPKVPTMFGGNGSTTYGSYTWFEAQELATAFGKRCLTQLEFMSAMYGTTEASSIGSDPSTTNWDAAYVSKWGINQATGCMWVWGRDRGGPAAAASWNANTEGRGSEYNAPNAPLFGGRWDNGSDAGSRCSLWNGSASVSVSGIGSRFACDHLQLG